MKLSLGITTHERPSLTLNSFREIYSDPRITDIVIVDDCSSMESYSQLKENITQGFYNVARKFRIHRNEQNLGMSRNKCEVVGLCRENFVLLADSDNKFGVDYLNAIEKLGKLEPDTIYCPDSARPSFIYKKFSGRTFDITNVKELVSDDMGNCSMNTSNYVVPREAYLETYEYNPDMKGTDTIWMAYLWLKAGGKFQIVDGLGYDHLQHTGSGFLQDLNYNMAQAEKIRKMILEL